MLPFPHYVTAGCIYQQESYFPLTLLHYTRRWFYKPLCNVGSAVTWIVFNCMCSTLSSHDFQVQKNHNWINYSKWSGQLLTAPGTTLNNNPGASSDIFAQLCWDLWALTFWTTSNTEIHSPSQLFLISSQFKAECHFIGSNWPSIINYLQCNPISIIKVQAVFLNYTPMSLWAASCGKTTLLLPFNLSFAFLSHDVIKIFTWH